MPKRWTMHVGSPSGARAVAIGVKKFRKPGILLEEGEVFVVACVITILRPKLYGQLQVFHCRLGFPRKAIKGRHSVDDVIGFRSQLSRAQKMIAGFVPPPHIHHGHALLIMLLGCARRDGLGTLQTLFDNAEMDASAVGEILSRSGNHFFELGLGPSIFLLLEMLYGLFEGSQLLLGAGIDEGLQPFLTPRPS